MRRCILLAVADHARADDLAALQSGNGAGKKRARKQIHVAGHIATVLMPEQDFIS